MAADDRAVGSGPNYKLYTVDLEVAPAWLPRRGLAGVGEAVEQPQLPRPLAPELVLRGGAVVERGRAHPRVGVVGPLVLRGEAPAGEADAADRDHHPGPHAPATAVPTVRRWTCSIPSRSSSQRPSETSTAQSGRPSREVAGRQAQCRTRVGLRATRTQPPGRPSTPACSTRPTWRPAPRQSAAIARAWARASSAAGAGGSRPASPGAAVIPHLRGKSGPTPPPLADARADDT